MHLSGQLSQLCTSSLHAGQLSRTVVTNTGPPGKGCQHMYGDPVCSIISSFGILPAFGCHQNLSSPPIHTDN
jgi:hypothetical protein